MKRNPLTEEENAKIRSLAGRMSASNITAELGRTKAALVMHASKLKISLRTGWRVTFKGDFPSATVGSRSG